MACISVNLAQSREFGKPPAIAVSYPVRCLGLRSVSTRPATKKRTRRHEGNASVRLYPGQLLRACENSQRHETTEEIIGCPERYLAIKSSLKNLAGSGLCFATKIAIARLNTASSCSDPAASKLARPDGNSLAVNAASSVANVSRSAKPRAMCSSL
jgi:hypothetical protein